jgi:hypothetical protein
LSAGTGVGVGLGVGAADKLGLRLGLGLALGLGLGLSLGTRLGLALGLGEATSVADGSALGDPVGTAASSVGVALASGVLVAWTSRMPASRETMITAMARPTSTRSRRRRPFRGAAAATTGRGISGPVGAKGGRGRTVPVIVLATHVRQLRRDVLQHSLHTNCRHSWQKRKLWTKD